jgi:AAA-like domain
VRQPLTFAYRNLVFGTELRDCWALYRLETRSYAGLPVSEKRELLSLVAAFAYTIERDFQLLRVSRAWDVERYASGVERQADTCHGHPSLLRSHLERHREALAERRPWRPEVYLAVRLADATGEGGAGRPLTGTWLRRLAGLGDARGISQRRLEALLDEEAKLLARVEDFLACERAATHEVAWLVRRAFARALAEPEVEERFRPQALIVEDHSGDGGRSLRPLEVDLLRLMDCPIELKARSLAIDTEAGRSHQAFLCLGALPEEAPFPGRQSELLFAPLEALGFPVDACLSARYVANEQAVRLVRRRIVDADNAYAEEAHGEHGPSSDTAQRPRLARELEDYLSAGERPPLLRATVSLCVAAAGEDELEQRVERLRREYGALRLHRPLGGQLELFVSQLPAQATGVAGYDDYLTVEQVGAMVPIATDAVGAEAGPYIGSTLSGARRPVLFDSTEASRTSRAPATLLAGTLGSGKTLCMELVMYQAFLQGSLVCDIDPKGDHRFERLPGVAEALEVIELSAGERHRGMLDPLRIAPADTREDLAVQFLTAVLPEPVRPEWQTEIRLAVQAACAQGRRCCGAVLAELERGGPEAVEAARALAVHASSGLARLGFAEVGREPPLAAERQVTSLRIRNLTLPLPGVRRSELLEDERVGQALLRLLAVYALRLTGADPTRHAVLGFDEAWVLLADSAGRALVERISRLGRAQNVTPLLATQVLGDIDELGGLIGALFCFGVETEQEARRALELLRLDPDDARLVRQLTGFRRGRCLMRDYTGRVGAVQIDLVDPGLLELLDTTPQRPPAVAPEQTDDALEVASR